MDVHSGETPTTAMPIEDDFSDPASGWPKDNDKLVTLEYTDGDYRILVKQPGPEDSKLMFGSAEKPLAVKSVSVEADATERAGPRTSGVTDTFEFQGVACWGAEAQSDRPSVAYKFVITPVGHYGILKDHLSSSGLETLIDGDGDFGGFGATNRIRGECTVGRDRSTSLVLYVDGTKVMEATDPDGPDGFPAVGLTVETSEGGTDVRFDNFVARELGKICTQDGIHFAGTTRQGAEVCFTLTPDRAAWVEFGFTFLEASGCPDMGEGTVHIQAAPTPLNSYGRIETPASFAPVSFSAFIRPDDDLAASGVFADSEICPGKTFKWNARIPP